MDDSSTIVMSILTIAIFQFYSKWLLPSLLYSFETLDIFDKRSSFAIIVPLQNRDLQMRQFVKWMESYLTNNYIGKDGKEKEDILGLKKFTNCYNCVHAGLIWCSKEKKCSFPEDLERRGQFGTNYCKNGMGSKPHHAVSFGLLKKRGRGTAHRKNVNRRFLDPSLLFTYHSLCHFEKERNQII